MQNYASFTDEYLVSFIKKGDRKAFQELYERHWSVLADHIFRVTKSKTEAQDIIQEIFVSIWKRRELLDIHGDVVAYLMRAAKNLSLRYIEKNITKEKFLVSLKQFTQTIGPSQLSEMEINELEKAIQGAIDQLPSKMQEIFLLSRMENLSYKEIAQRLSIAETTVKKQISNALKSIRNNIQSQKYELLVFYALIFFSKKS